MQTFLPFPNFSASAAILDDRRLNKQIVEGYQILTGRLPNRNHPACLMWQGREDSLRLYIMACGEEYTRRTGKHHACGEGIDSPHAATIPPWLGDRLFHLSHRVNLLRKEPDHYAHLLDRIPYPDLDAYPTGYFWPVEPVGRKAKADRAAWLEWGKANKIR